MLVFVSSICQSGFGIDEPLDDPSLNYIVPADIVPIVLLYGFLIGDDGSPKLRVSRPQSPEIEECCDAETA